MLKSALMEENFVNKAFDEFREDFENKMNIPVFPLSDKAVEKINLILKDSPNGKPSAAYKLVNKINSAYDQTHSFHLVLREGAIVNLTCKKKHP